MAIAKIMIFTKRKQLKERVGPWNPMPYSLIVNFRTAMLFKVIISGKSKLKRTRTQVGNKAYFVIKG